MPGEEVEIELRLTNASTEPVIVAPLPPSLRLLTAGAEPESEKVVRSFPAGTEEVKLAINEATTYKIIWNQRDDEGKQVSPGWYYGNVEFGIRREKSLEEEARTGSTERLFLIQYPQGAMEKVIELNQVQTATNLPFVVDGEVNSVDIVVTLKRVELSQEKTSFFVWLTSPNNPLPGYDNVWWRSGRNYARYVIEGVVKDARSAYRQYSNDGIELTWGYKGSYLDPVPSDAKELNFIITRLGEWEGPWEFHVPLE